MEKITVKWNWNILFAIVIVIALWGCERKKYGDQDNIKCSFISSYKQIQVLAGNKLFTTLLYDTTITQPNGVPLMKPVLWPVYSPSEIVVQRQFPLRLVNGESRDEPHHEGIFFAYSSNGEVNGNSFWAGQQGDTRIVQTKITQRETNHGKAILGTRNNWIGRDGNVVLVEDRKMIFSASKPQRSIDFTFHLIAQNKDVMFKDTKEGMFAIRVADWLAENSHGNPNPPLAEKHTGMYLNSKGDTTSKNVWGKRAKWVRLEGHHNGKTVGIIIMNHPSSVNYPTFWHARGYGLFAADPLGQSVFQKARGKNPVPLNYTIAAGDSALFKFKMVIYEGHRGIDQIKKEFKKYSSSK